MKNNRLKNILYEIQKLAGPTIKSPSGGSGGTGGSSGGGGGGTGGGTGGSAVAATNAIKEMQKAIGKFADAVVNYDIETVFENVGGNKVPKKDKSGNFVTQVKKEDDRKDFNDFIAERGSSIKTEEWDPDPTRRTISEKRPTDRIELDTVLNLLKRTGSQFSETNPDGIWNERTQNAIKTVWALTDSFLNIAEDYGVYDRIQSTFSFKDLNTLKSNIPTGSLEDVTKLPPAQKENKAKVLTPLVKKATNLYNQFKEIILKNPIHQNYINGTYGLMTAKPGQADPGEIPENLKNKNLTEEYISNFYVTNGKGARVFVNQKVPLNAFENVPNFLKFLRWIEYDETNGINDPNIQSKVLKEIMDQVFSP